MSKKTLHIPFNFPALYVCRYCKTEVRKKDIIAGRAKEIDATTCICPDCLLRPKTQNIQAEAQPPVVETKRTTHRLVAENEIFISMILAAQEDPTMKERILTIARLTSFHRQSLINSLVTDLNMQGKKASALASAIACLKDDDVALKTIEVLTK